MDSKNKDLPKELDEPDFTALTKYVKSLVENIAEDGYPGKDYENYCFEQALEAVYGKKIWKYWNSKIQ